MKTTFSLSEVRDIQFSQACLQGPCLHTVQITLLGREDPLVVTEVIGNNIARMLRVKNKRTGAHFNWFLTTPGWSTSTQAQHLNKEPIQIGPFLFTYPEKYKSKPMNLVKLPPPRARKPSPDDEPSERGRQYCLKHGIIGSKISLREAKWLVKVRRGGMV